MDIGNPVIYKCPSCGKKMQMTTFTSYTVSSSKYFSDGYIDQSGVCCPYFTPDLAKCPHCKELFFRSNVKDAESVNFYENKVKADIEDPERDDLISVIKNKIEKKGQKTAKFSQQKEKVIREMLWRSLNDDTRQGYNQLDGDLLKIWQDNCAALLPLTEKTLKEMKLEKNKKKYDKDDIENCVLMTAELSRNLGKFDKSMEIIKELGGKWAWLKKQFAWECKAKNIFTFELMTKKEMNLEKEKVQYGEDYFKRAKKYLPVFYGRRDLKKILADYNKAESLGMKSSIFYKTRSLFYLDELNDTDKALADIQTAINEDKNDDRLYTVRSKIYEKMGDVKSAENNKLKAETMFKEKQDEWKTVKKKPVRGRKGKGISEL